jgi:L-asparaginase II
MRARIDQPVMECVICGDHPSGDATLARDVHDGARRAHDAVAVQVHHVVVRQVGAMQVSVGKTAQRCTRRNSQARSLNIADDW